MHKFLVLAAVPLLSAISLAAASGAEPRVLRAGAFAADVTPTRFPVIVNGGFLAATAGRANDRLHARWLVLDNGETRVALGVLDTCVIPREFADQVKAAAQAATGIPPERIMLSATHTHSAPSLMQALGTPADPDYPAFAVPRIVEGLQRAVANLAPARVGWATAQAPRHTHNRVWIRRPDRLLTDPFGERNVRANMHPGYQNPDTIGPSGPADPELTVLAVKSPEGRPLAVLANFSMHYFGSGAVSADYYGVFAEKLRQMLAPNDAAPAFVGIMSQGTSGDLHWMDYRQPQRSVGRDTYAEELARLAADACRTIRYLDWVPLAMREKELTLATRQPDDNRLAWARGVVDKLAGQGPKSIPEVYAREQFWLKDNPTRLLKLQALRVGDLGIAIWPCEVFAISGLKIKARSPLRPTMNIELANAEEGYIPPPELHPLGGYNTWPCRTAGLEVQAEPKIVDALLGLLEEVSGQPRREIHDTHGAYAQAVLAARPLAYWRMNDFTGPSAPDATGGHHSGTYEPGVVFYLDGPSSAAFCGPEAINRAAHFAGGRLLSNLKELSETYTVQLWFWNGLPETLRPVTGYLFCRGAQESLALGGTATAPGKLVFVGSGSAPLVGTTTIALRTWNHVALVRDGQRVAVYLNGNPTPEISGRSEPAPQPDAEQFSLGGRADRDSTFEGKLDEVAIYNRALPHQEIARFQELAGVKNVSSGTP